MFLPLQLTRSHISVIVLSEHMMWIGAIIAESQYACAQYLKKKNTNKLDRVKFNKTESCVMPNQATHSPKEYKQKHNQTQSAKFRI